MPKISVIFVHYSTDDVKSYLGMACLKRLWNSVRKSSTTTEIIVVNNGDRDEKRCKELADTYIKNDRNSLGGARNKGFDASFGEYVCFIDNDVYADFPFLDACMELLEKYPDRKLIATPVYTTSHMFGKFIKGDLGGHMLNTRAGSNCMFMKRESFLDIGRFQEPDYSRSYHGKDGVEFCDRQNQKGYLMILTRIVLVRDIGLYKYHYGTKRHNSGV